MKFLYPVAPPVTCVVERAPNLRIRALTNMGTPSNDPLATTRSGLSRLTAGELEVCVLHFADGRPQPLIADWLGTTLRAVQLKVQSAVEKVPELRPLMSKSRFKPKRPKVLHLSQLTRMGGREPFNIDEV